MNTIYCGDWDFKGQIQGVKAFIQNSKTGRWEEKGIYGDQPGQSILTIAGDWLISICELGQGGKVVSYRIEEDGSLSQRCIAAFDSAKLSYVVASPNGKYVFVSSMGDGTVKMIRLGEHGELTLTDEFKLTGHGVTPRQAHAKVHSVMISPDGTLLAAANLGADEVELFQVDYEKEILRLSDSQPVDFGREPRHMAFHPEGKYLYVLTEGGNRLYVYTLQAGKLREMATYETRSMKGEQKGAAADILVSRDGKFIYTTNRGQHNIAVWKILNSGLLDIAAYCDCGGQGPRGICFSTNGKWIFSANNDDGTVTVLPVDQETGLLGESCQKLEVPLAGCVRFCS